MKGADCPLASPLSWPTTTPGDAVRGPSVSTISTSSPHRFPSFYPYPYLLLFLSILPSSRVRARPLRIMKSTLSRHVMQSTRLSSFFFFFLIFLFLVMARPASGRSSRIKRSLGGLSNVQFLSTKLFFYFFIFLLKVEILGR